jgi:hypothetical protein
MEHASMVHALGEIRRVLVPGGVLLDLRPMEERWPIEIVWNGGSKEAARLAVLPGYQEDEQAADRAMAEAESLGWYGREEHALVPYRYYWDTPSEMKEAIEEEWEEPDKLEAKAYRAVQGAWAVANADARVCVNMALSFTRWRKLR